MFEDPVIENNSCAHMFERMFIQQWLLDHNTCPLSRGPLQMEQLVSHTILRDACALLNPKRAEDLTREDIDLLKHAEKVFLKRKL